MAFVEREHFEKMIPTTIQVGGNYTDISRQGRILPI